jgi:hypothetical protein
MTGVWRKMTGIFLIKFYQNLPVDHTCADEAWSIETDPTVVAVIAALVLLSTLFSTGLTNGSSQT